MIRVSKLFLRICFNSNFLPKILKNDSLLVGAERNGGGNILHRVDGDYCFLWRLEARFYEVGCRALFGANLYLGQAKISLFG